MKFGRETGPSILEKPWNNKCEEPKMFINTKLPDSQTGHHHHTTHIYHLIIVVAKNHTLQCSHQNRTPSGCIVNYDFGIAPRSSHLEYHHLICHYSLLS